MLKLLKKPIKRIMLVEDDEFDHNMLRDYLLAQGFAVISVKDAKNLEEKIAYEQPHAIFTALMLNDFINGSELVEKIRSSKLSDIPIVGMSAQVNDEAGYFYSICDHSLQKPLSISAINKVISNLF